MPIAVVSDIHGNWTAFETVMAEIRRLGIDQVVCLGDTVNPLPSSKRVLRSLIDSGIPVIRGNHEDYIITAHEAIDGEIARHLRFRPVQLVSKTFDPHDVEQMRRLPLKIEMDGFLFCHASPGSNNKGWKHGVSVELAAEIERVEATTIVCGHWHDPQTISWNDKTLVTAGSVGIPLAGKFEAEFLVMDETPLHLSVPYDHERALEEYIISGWFKDGGPIAWLLYAELATATRQVSKFFGWARERTLVTDSDWYDSIQAFMEESGSWSVVEPLLGFATHPR